MAGNHQGWQRGSGGTSQVISNPLEKETYPCPSQPVSIRQDPGYADVTSRGVGTFTNVTLVVSWATLGKDTLLPRFTEEGTEDIR